MNSRWQCGFTGTDAAPGTGTNAGGFALQRFSNLAAGGKQTESGAPQERQPAPFLKKVGWYAGVISALPC